MPSPELLAPFVLLALFGSLHCMGMCGGFALAAGAGSERGSRASAQLGLYVLGKALSYAVLGIAISLLAHRAEHLVEGGTEASAGGLDGVRRVLAWFAGAVIVACGLAAMGVRFPCVRGPLRRIVFAIEPVWRGILDLGPLSRSFGIGVSTGLLPCGLSWSALALATQVDPATAGIGLFLFGLGTGPALAAVGLARWVAPPAARRIGRAAIGPALVLLGLFTAARGGLPGVSASVVPDCCQAVGAEAPAE